MYISELPPLQLHSQLDLAATSKEDFNSKCRIQEIYRKMKASVYILVVVGFLATAESAPAPDPRFAFLISYRDALCTFRVFFIL